MDGLKQFTFLENYFEIIEQLNDEKKKEILFDIYNYMYKNIEPIFEENDIKKIAWLGLVTSLNTSKNRSWNNKNKTKSNKSQIKIKSKSKRKQKENKLPSTSTSIIYSIINNILEKIEYEKEKPFMNELDSLFNEYIELRIKEKMSVTDTVLNRLVNKLQPFNEDIKKQMLGNAINGKWKDLYEIQKEETKTKGFKKEEVKPSWFDEEIEIVPMPEEDRKRLEEMLKEYKD